MKELKKPKTLDDIWEERLLVSGERVVCVTPGVEGVQRGALRRSERDETGVSHAIVLVRLDNTADGAALWRHGTRFAYLESDWDAWANHPEHWQWKNDVRPPDPGRPETWEKPEGYRDSILPTDSAERKQYPIVTGALDYFPAAIAEVARLSYLANEKHNPGEPLHHSRGKSSDHDDCLGRHTLERGQWEIITIKGVEHKVLHSVCRAWRALAAAQIELEGLGRPLARAAK